MSDNLTGEKLRAFFQKCSSENSKVCLESPTDEKIADNLAIYFQPLGIEKCKKCIVEYVVHARTIAVSLTEFTMNLTEIIDKMKAREANEEERKRVMKRTRERMEGLN